MGVKSIVIEEKVGNYFSSPFKVGDIVHISPVPEKFRWPYFFLFNINIDDKRIVDEYPTYEGDPSIWDKDCFAPVSDIDETVMERQYAVKQSI